MGRFIRRARRKGIIPGCIFLGIEVWGIKGVIIFLYPIDCNNLSEVLDCYCCLSAGASDLVKLSIRIGKDTSNVIAREIRSTSYYFLQRCSKDIE